MKKGLVICLFSILLFGCSKNYKAELKKIGNSYYDNYINGKVNGLDKVEITLGDLKDIKKIDLSKVKSCKDNTKIIIKIKNNKIIGYDYELYCK